MILGFKHKGLELFFETKSVKGIQPTHASKLRRILIILNSAETWKQVNVPGFGLHSLKGDLKGFWGVSVNGNWRVTFTFNGVDVDLVDYLDYH